MVGPQLQSAAKTVGGLDQSTFFLERPTQIGVRLGRLRPQGGDTFPTGPSGGVVVVGGVSFRQQPPHFGVVGRQFDGSKQVGHSLRRPTLQLQSQAAIRLNAGHIGRQTQRFGKSGTGGVPAFQGAEDVAKVIVSGGQVGLQTNRFLTMRQGFIRLPLIDKNLAQVGASQSKVRGQRDGGAERFEGRIRLAQLAEDHTEVVLGQSECGSHSDGGAELFGGFLTPAESLEREAKVVGRFRVLRLQTKRGAAALDGLFILAKSAMRFGKVDVKISGVGPQRHSATH